MLQIATENLLVGVVGLALLLYMGGGLSRWLPVELAPYRWLIAPWAGYCLLVITTQFLTNEPFALTALQSAYVAAGLATLFWILDFGFWIRRRKVQSNIVRRPSSIVWVIFLSVGVFVLCVLPLWSYGYATVIGENWDVEVYLGLGEYLKSYPQSGLNMALPNPILDTLINPPYSLRTHGFSYVQAALGFLPLDSLHTLAPMLALLCALSIPAAYVFFRVGLRLRPAASLVASALLGLNAFLLWITYNMFGMQVPTFGLLQLAVCFTFVMLNSSIVHRPSSIVPSLWLGLCLAAVAVTYHPALTAFAAMALPPIAVMVVRYWRDGRAKRMLVSIGVATVVGVMLSLVSQLKSVDGFLKQYAEKTAGLGLTGFTAPGDALGFSLSFRDLLPADPGRPLYSLVLWAYGAMGWVALALALVLAASYIYGLSRQQDKSQAWGIGALLVGAAAYVLLFVWPLDYPYGWFKALAFVSFVFVGAAVGGLDRFRIGLFRNPKSEIRNQVRWMRVSGIAVGTAMLALMLFTTWQTVGRYWGEPVRYSREMVEAEAIRDVVVRNRGADGSVYVSNSPNMKPLGKLFYGLLSYYLRDTPIKGTFDTGNSKVNRESDNGLYRFSLLHTDDNPSEYGVGHAKLVWHNLLLSLYEYSQEQQRFDLYHHNYRGEKSYPIVGTGKPLTLSVKSDKIGIGQLDVSAGGSSSLMLRQLTLGLATFTTATLRFDAGGQYDVVVVPPGYTTYTSAPITAPVEVNVSPAGISPIGGDVYVRWSHLEEYSGASEQPQGLAADGPCSLMGVSSTQESGDIATNVQYLNNRPGAASQILSLDIYSNGKSGGSQHYGYWNVGVPANTPMNLRLLLDPMNKLLKLYGPSSISMPDQFAGTTGDGSYTASLLVYENGRVAETFNDVFTFTIKDGKLESFKPRDLPPQFR